MGPMGCATKQKNGQMYGQSQCELCGKYVKCLEKHVEKNHGTGYQCEHCGKSCKTQKSLNYHITTIHSEQFCDQCFKAFSNRRLLNNHIRSVHSGTYLKSCKWIT